MKKAFRSMKISNLIHQTRTMGLNPVTWVFAGGLAVRIYSAALRCIINPDGAQYIYQAGAIFNGNWSDLLACKLTYVSPLPFLIAASFGLFRDWIIAAQAVNVLLGWATLFPLFLLLRRFTDNSVSILTVLIFALMPVLVEGSGDVLRGPLFWFCLSMGLLMFVRQWDEPALTGRFRIDILLSSLFFLLASWTRIEGLALFAASALYLAISRHDAKMQRILIFVSPVLLIGLGAASILIASGKDPETVLHLKQVLQEPTQFLSQYADLNNQIASAYSRERGIYGEFLRRSKEILGFIPVISIVYNILEGIFYPFAIVFFIGFGGLIKRSRQDRRVGYLLCLTLAGLIVLYIHILQVWILAYRFLAICIFPGCILIANGIERIMGYLQSRRHWRRATTIGAISTFLILFGLPKSLKPEEQDKIVYRQAAQTIAAENEAGQVARVGAVTSSRAFEWVLLYAHRKDSIIPCARGMITDITVSYDSFVKQLDESGVRYFFYEDRFWPKKGFELADALYRQDFRILGRWRHPDSKAFILFKRKSDRD
jgi:hypothetical protein